MHSLVGPHRRFTRGKGFNRTLLVTNSGNVTNTSMLTTHTYLHSKMKLLAMRTPVYGGSVLRASIPRTVMRASTGRAYFTVPASASSCRTINVNPKLKEDRRARTTLLRRLRRYRAPMMISTSTLGVLTGRHRALARLPGNSVLAPRPGRLRQLANGYRSSCRQLAGTYRLTRTTGMRVVLGNTCSTVVAPTKGYCFGPAKGPKVTAKNDNSMLAKIVLTLLTRNCPTRSTTGVNACVRKLTKSFTRGGRKVVKLVTDSVVAYLPAT